MPVTNFYTVDGEIIGEKTAGSSRIDYLTDALGSVTATVNQNAQVVNTYRYKPFGALLAKTGTGPDASFGWVGTQGYRPTGRKFSEHYIRKRHYADTLGRWPNVDPIGHRGGLNGYLYVSAQPILLVDPSGFQEAMPSPGGPYIPRPIRTPPLRIVGPRIGPAPQFPSWVLGCLTCVLVGVGIVCSQEPAGDSEKEEPGKSCEDLHPGMPASNSVYNECTSYFGSQLTSHAKGCDSEASNALADIKAELGMKNLKMVCADSTGGPCVGNGRHCKVLNGKKLVVDILCCKTCDDLPGSRIAVLGCKCCIYEKPDWW